MSLRRAVHRKAVPGDLEADLLRLAAAIEPLVPNVGHPLFKNMLSRCLYLAKRWL